MRNMLSVLLTASLLVFPFATYAEDYGSQQPQNQQSPPVAQPLVREGDFAIKLAAQLNLGTPDTEATAEDMLVRAGVMPANGWISDYPVTPEIIGQLSDSIVNASQSGTLAMGSDKAEEQLTEVTQSMDLPLPASAGRSQSATPAQPNPTIVNNYYYDQGPPVVTYYPPPVEYVYLYDWVPFPVVWFGISFPGFYICHNFTTIVVDHFHRDHFHRAIVTNHVIDRRTRRSAVVDPVVRSGGSVRAETMLRSESGRTFRTMPDFRNAHAGRGSVGRPPGVSRFTSPDGERSAAAIRSRSIEAMRAQRFSGTMARNFPGSRSLQPPINRGSAITRTSPSMHPVPGQPYNTVRPNGRQFEMPHRAPNPGGMRPGGSGSWQGRAAGGGMLPGGRR